VGDKFESVVDALGLGGVMVWGLRDDSAGWSRVRAMGRACK
jgi:hypothetical protein